MEMNVVSPVLLGIALGTAGVPLFNRIPASWLVDYDESPDEERLSKSRIAAKPWAPIFIVLMAALGGLVASNSQSTALSFIAVLAVWVLVLAAVSDAKYTIIPDQAVVALAFLGVVAAVVRGVAGEGIAPELLSSALGALVGAGSSFLIGLVGSALAKRDAMGYGDIKLLAAAGLLVGFPGIVYVLALVVLVAGIVFMLLILAKRLEIGQATALGPYISLATALFLVFSLELQMMFSSYLALFGNSGGIG